MPPNQPPLTVPILMTAKQRPPKSAWIEFPGTPITEPASDPLPESLPVEPPPSLQFSPPLKKEVRRLTGQGMGIEAAVRQLAESNPELFTSPGDKVARLLASWNEAECDQPQ